MVLHLGDNRGSSSSSVRRTHYRHGPVLPSWLQWGKKHCHMESSNSKNTLERRQRQGSQYVYDVRCTYCVPVYSAGATIQSIHVSSHTGQPKTHNCTEINYNFFPLAVGSRFLAAWFVYFCRRRMDGVGFDFECIFSMKTKISTGILVPVHSKYLHHMNRDVCWRTQIMLFLCIFCSALSPILQLEPCAPLRVYNFYFCEVLACRATGNAIKLEDAMIKITPQGCIRYCHI